jgi:acyl-lipid omega-6 desaturase (Delta-12 desaturase)
MHEGKEIILSTKPFAKEIRWKSWYYTLSTLIIFLAFFLGTLFMPTILGKIFCSIFAGLVMIRVFVIYHDYQHHSILYKSFPAKIIFKLWGMYMLSPESIWKRSHDYHHNHNSKLFSASIGSYPIWTKEKYLNASKSDRTAYLFSRHPLNILFGYITMFVYGMCIQSFRSSPKRHWDSLLAIIIHIGASVYLFIHFGWITWLLTIAIPFFTSLMVGAYLFYAQHNFPGVTFKNNVEWSYVHASLQSSSFMKMNPFWRWMTANIGFHHIHHMNSRIPFYRLPEAMQHLPALQNPVITTLNPSDIVACLKLKVWDAQKNKMIPLSQL